MVQNKTKFILHFLLCFILSLTTIFAAENAPSSKDLVLAKHSVAEIDFEEFAGVEEHFSLNGEAKTVIDEFSQDDKERTILRLTPRLSNADGQIAGSAYIKYPFRAFREGYPFSSFFRYRVTASNIYDGSGMVFVIHSDKRHHKALGKCKYCMGFSGSARLGGIGVKPSVGIEFDIQRNGSDYDYNMVGLNFHGSAKSKYVHSGAFQPNSRSETNESPYTDSQINNGIPWNVWIDFDGTIIEVRSSQEDSREEATLHLRREINMPDAMSLKKTEGEEVEPFVYVGFSADPGLYPAYTDVLEWKFRSFYKPYGDYCGNIIDKNERAECVRIMKNYKKKE